MEIKKQFELITDFFKKEKYDLKEYYNEIIGE
jgi:hypothetical protein